MRKENIMDFKAHVELKAKELGVTIAVGEVGERAFTVNKIVVIDEVVDEMTFSTAMHELGHNRGDRFIDTLQEERAAWDWAVANSPEWTPTMARNMEMALETYEMGAQFEQMVAAMGNSESAAWAAGRKSAPVAPSRQSVGSFLDGIGIKR